MIQHVYVSSATSLFRPADLGEILRKARETNERLGITGMLVYRDPFFMQVLEGPADSIAELLVKIEADSRHGKITTILNAPLRFRAFEDWSMGFYEVRLGSVPEVVMQYDGYRDFFAADFEPRIFAANPSAAKKLLLAFRDECIRPHGRLPRPAQQS